MPTGRSKKNDLTRRLNNATRLPRIDVIGYGNIVGLRRFSIVCFLSLCHNLFSSKFFFSFVSLLNCVVSLLALSRCSIASSCLASSSLAVMTIDRDLRVCTHFEEEQSMAQFIHLRDPSKTAQKCLASRKKTLDAVNPGDWQFARGCRRQTAFRRP